MAQVKPALLFAALAPAFGLALATPARAAEPIQPGDRMHAAQLWKANCAGCHGPGTAQPDPTPLGLRLGAQPLRNPALLAARTDDDLITAVLKGGPGAGSPAFKFFSLLDAADLVAFLRQGQPTIADVFPDAAAYTAKTYTLQGPALTRAESLSGVEFPASERELMVFMVYKGDRPALGPRVVPQDPIKLDALSPRDRLGFVVFGALSPGKGQEPVPYALGLANDFSVQRLLSGGAALDLSKVTAGVVGKGGREPGKRKPFVSKGAPEQAAAITRLYARAVELAAIANKEESDRHLFDAPDKK
ncbi:MAG: cytochrome c [Deltaproteobacteria bacterium]|nr:cytochrome c [Deltaproteobacteria bacterium]